MTQDEILDAYEVPFNRGECPGATHRAKVINPVCGDDVEITLRVEEGKIVDAWHKAHGCVLSCASASELCRVVSGSEFPNLPGMKSWVERFGVLTPRRRQCVAMAYEALQSALVHGLTETKEGG